MANLGPTGNFPQGKLTKDDEGEIRLAVGVVDKKVIIDFGIAIKWIGMDPEQAFELAQLLVKNARIAAKGE